MFCTLPDAVLHETAKNYTCLVGEQTAVPDAQR